MNANTSKKRNAVVKNSGNNMQYQQCDEFGALLDPADTWHEFPHIQESTTKKTTEQEKVINETGKLTRKVDVSREVMINGIFQQSDKDTLDFLGNDCADKYYRIYRYEGIVDGKHQEFFFGICQITPAIELKSGVKRPPFEITVLDNETAITIASESLPEDAHADAEVVIAEGRFYEIVETAQA